MLSFKKQTKSKCSIFLILPLSLLSPPASAPPVGHPCKPSPWEALAVESAGPRRLYYSTHAIAYTGAAQALPGPLH